MTFALTHQNNYQAMFNLFLYNPKSEKLGTFCKMQ